MTQGATTTGKNRSGILRNFVLAFGLLLTSPACAAWDAFEIIEWQPRNPAQLAMLHRLGVTAVAVVADRDGTSTRLDQEIVAPRTAGLRWYIENIATDFYASYHRYTPDRVVNWRFLAAQRRYRANPTDTAALFRDPPLLDPNVRARIGDRLTATVRQQQPFNPLYYSLGDETGIADLAAFWDFDLSPTSLVGFRIWLRGQYGSLAALNAEWGTTYDDWDAIQPEVTRDAMRRTDDNFAQWNDFKACMDAEFADALRFGTDTIHHADPHALSAIEGVQLPGWGGYDYAQIAPAVDVMEVYDSDENIPLVHAINPAVIPLITSFGATPTNIHGIWRSVLRGARGLILWDEDNSIVGRDGSLRPRAAAYVQVFAALHSEIGRSLIAAEPIYDPVAILYSPASFRVNWLLDHRHDGDAWMDRSAASEWQDNVWRIALRDYTDALARMDLHPRFITEDELAHGPPKVSALILPHSIALSDEEARAIATFAANGGQVIADVPPGEFDWHGRRRGASNIPARLVSPEDLPNVLTIAPRFRVEAPDNDVDTYLFRSRGKQVLALQRRKPAEAPENVTVILHGWQARDIANDRDYGRQQRLALTLAPITPTVLELVP